MTLRRQINVRILLSILMVLVLGAGLVILQARQAITEEISSSVNLAIQLIQWGVSEMDVVSMEQHQRLEKISALTPTRHLNIQIKQPSGEMIELTANRTLSDLSQAPDWFVWAVSGKAQQRIEQVMINDQQSLQIIISANPLDEIDEAWQETRVFFAIILLLSVALFLAVNLAFKNVFKIVNTILYSLNDITNKSYSKKLPHFAIDEFEQIALAVNQLTETLETAKQENRALTQHSLQIEEEQRQILAQELHDELGQSLTAIKVMAVTAKKQSQTVESNNSIISICDHLFDVLRSMMKNLHPMELTELGLKASLQSLIEQWHSRYPDLQIELHCPEQILLNKPHYAIQIFRVIQEAITNTVRHANASVMVIDIDQINAADAENLSLTISDNGQGCHSAQINFGFGLLGMQSRINSLEGTIEFTSVAGQGMTISVNVPVKGITDAH